MHPPRLRRTWRKLPYWQSDAQLFFRRPVKLGDGPYRRAEYLVRSKSTQRHNSGAPCTRSYLPSFSRLTPQYVGRTYAKGELTVNISLEGRNKGFFAVSPKTATVQNGGYVRIKVQYLAKHRKTVKGVDAYVVIRNNVNGVRKVKILGT